jgi:hypothetical protein
MSDEELPRDYSDIPEGLVDLQRKIKALTIAKEDAKMRINECKATFAEHAARIGGGMTWPRLIYEPEYVELANEMFRARSEKSRARTELEPLEGSVEMEACAACVDPARVVQAAYLAYRLEQQGQSQ